MTAGFASSPLSNRGTYRPFESLDDRIGQLAGYIRRLVVVLQGTEAGNLGAGREFSPIITTRFFRPEMRSLLDTLIPGLIADGFATDAERQQIDSVYNSTERTIEGAPLQTPEVSRATAKAVWETPER